MIKQTFLHISWYFIKKKREEKKIHQNLKQIL